MSYLILKLLHVLAVILFLGNITTGLFWKAHADRTADPEIMAHAVAGIIRSDRWFTMPGVVVILAAGFGAAIAGGMPILGVGWIFWSLVLFTISGLAFALRVAPLQRQMLGLARQRSERGEFDEDLHRQYRKRTREWEIWGLIALLAPFGAVVLMILKPSLPGL